MSAKKPQSGKARNMGASKRDNEPASSEHAAAPDQHSPPAEPAAEAEEPAGEAAESAGDLVGTDQTEDQASPEDTLIVVGIGASAGGLEAFNELLQHLAADTGMSFVFVQHLAPQHKSNLAEILGRSTPMPVHEASDQIRLEPNHIYVIPPDRDIALLHGLLHLMRRPATGRVHLPIDAFFRSLAEDRGSLGIGIVLSGTGSDGALGLRAIKAEGGLTFAQDQASAKYSGMPASAAETEVDFVLTPKMIAMELVSIGRHRGTRALDRLLLGRPAARFPEEDLQKIFIVLRRATGVDFTYYKRSTVERRIVRRMVLHKLDSAAHYLRYLQQTPDEVKTLFDDMLINVTSFFREPDSFEALKASVFPRFLQDKGGDTPIRMWVPGGSTGEEAFSLAIVLLEFLGRDADQRPIQIFSTDISDVGVQRAREGRFPENIAADVSPERLRRFFQKTDKGYQIGKTVRDLCVVARQNVIRDPPFSNLDLISCRNLLIYMGPVLQKKILSVFHYALRQGGFLVLGKSETIGGFADLFSLADKKHKFYLRKPVTSRLPADLSGPLEAPHLVIPKGDRAAPSAGIDFEREIDRAIASQRQIAGVVIDENMNVLHVRGQTGRFLEPAPGQPSLNLARLVRSGLNVDLRTSLHRARTENQPTRKEGLRVVQDGQTVEINLEVIPFSARGQHDRHFFVLFEEVSAAKTPQGTGRKRNKESKAEVNRELEDALRELAETKESLRTIIEQYEEVNEELRAANEEIQSSNEELQSTNEELETAKEELQSTNEELSTLNEELENGNRDLTSTLNDYNNLLASVDIPVVMVDTHQRIRLFTPMASNALRLIAADRGRAIHELNIGIAIPDLAAKISSVMKDLGVYDEEIQLHNGRWYNLRIRPYKTADNRIEGVVLAFVDINDRKAEEERRARAREDAFQRNLAEGIAATVREPLVTLDGRLRVVSANRAFYRLCGGEPSRTEGAMFYELGGGRWDRPGLRALLEEVIPKNAVMENYQIEDDFPGLGRRRLLLNARRIDQEGIPQLILLAIEDASDDRSQP